MKEFIFNKKDYKSYKEFYEDIALKMDAKNDLNCLEPENLAYNANHLFEFLNDFYAEKYKFVFKNFDLEKIKQTKNYEDYEWNIIFEVFKDFVEQYPNNILEIVNEG